MRKIFEDFFDEVDVETAEQQIESPEEDCDERLSISIYPFYMQIDEKLDQKIFHQFFVKLNAFCSDSVLFDEYKLTIDYNYREIQSRTRLLGTVDDFNDFDKLIEEYNNNHIEGWAKFIVNIIFKKPLKCSLNLFRKTISDIQKIAYNVHIKHYIDKTISVNIESICGYHDDKEIKMFHMTIDKHYWVSGAIEEYYELLYSTNKDKDDSQTNKTNGKFYNGPLLLSDKSNKKARDFRPGDVLYSTLNGELVSQKQSDGHNNVPIAVCAVNDAESNCVQFVSLNYLNCSDYKHGDKLPMLFYYPMTNDLCGANKQSKLNFTDNRVSNNYNKWFNKPIEDEEYAKHFLSGSENYEIMMREVSKFTHISNGAPADQLNGGAVLTYNYRTLGTRCGDWYIPSASELYRMSLNNNAVETSRYDISGSTLFNVAQSFMTSGELDKAQYIKYGYHPQYHSACVSSKGIMAPIIVFMQIKK